MLKMLKKLLFYINDDFFVSFIQFYLILLAL